MIKNIVLTEEVLFTLLCSRFFSFMYCVICNTAACVEVLVSGGLVSEGAATPCGATYTSVGKVTLAKPAPQARTRELRYILPHF